MNPKYHLIGVYSEKPVYFSKEHGLLLGGGTEEFEEPSDLEKEAIIKWLGGMETIDRLVRNYERSEAREAKKNG